jgi:3-oxoacyl-[acyl-carrier-protein] synthase-1
MSAVAVKASGMVTSVGFNSASSCAAMRAGIRNVNETNLWDAESGEYLPAGKVSLPHWWVGLGKLAELVAPAIQECLEAAEPVPASAIPVFIGLASGERPHRWQGLETRILTEVQDRLGFPLHRESRPLPRDRVSVLEALIAGERLIDAGVAPCFIVAAVDSFLRQEVAEHYLARRRLLTPKNSNGFSLGEAGSAILVAAAGSADELLIEGIGFGNERATIESEEPLRAEGLIQAVAQALQKAGRKIEDLHYRITDLNGEQYRFKEMALAMMRVERVHRDSLFGLWHPIEHIGDVGAAIGPLLLGVALDAGRKRYGGGPNVLCTFGNDDGARGALIVTFRR